jgi:hypothetical protein
LRAGEKRLSQWRDLKILIREQSKNNSSFWGGETAVFLAVYPDFSSSSEGPLNGGSACRAIDHQLTGIAFTIYAEKNFLFD